MADKKNIQIAVHAVVHKRVLEIKKKTGLPIKIIVAKAIDLLSKEMNNGNNK